MRVAMISDIHGNGVALESVLRDIEEQRVDQIVCLGDVAVGGPQPRQVIERLQALGCPVVMGNADAELLAPVHEATAWFRDQLTPEHLGYVSTFAPTVAVTMGEGTTLLCFHGSPRSYLDVIMVTTPSQEIGPMLSGHHAMLFAGGHTHVQMVRRYKDRIIVNPGSVGLPFDQNPWTDDVPREEIRLAPWAEYGILTYTGGQFSLELRRVPLDVAELKRAALASSWPGAAEWAESWRG